MKFDPRINPEKIGSYFRGGNNDNYIIGELGYFCSFLDAFKDLNNAISGNFGASIALPKCVSLPNLKMTLWPDTVIFIQSVKWLHSIEHIRRQSSGSCSRLANICS